MEEATISFENEWNPGEYRLLDVTDEGLLDLVETSDEPLVIRGLHTDNAVLCTSKETYSMRSLHTSNTLCLAVDVAHKSEAEDQQIRVADLLSSIWELVPIVPRWDRLVEKLNQAQLSLDQFSNDASLPTGCNINDILDTVQASEFEIVNMLRNLRAVNLNGSYYRLTDESLYQLLEWVLTCLRAEGRSLDNVDVHWLLREIRSIVNEDIPELVVTHALSVFSENDKSEVASLSKQKISLFLAESLLSFQRVQREQDLLNEWQSLVDHFLGLDAFAVSTDLLVREALVWVEDGSKHARTLHYLPQTSLPHEPSQRFKALFAARKQWTYDSLLPYIQSLDSDKKKVDALLFKYARANTVSGVGKIYMSRAN